MVQLRISHPHGASPAELAFHASIAALAQERARALFQTGMLTFRCFADGDDRVDFIIEGPRAAVHDLLKSLEQYGLSSLGDSFLALDDPALKSAASLSP